MQNNVLVRLEQLNSKGSGQVFEILPGRQLRVTAITGKKQRDFSADLLAIDPESRSRWIIPRIRIGLMLAAFIAAAICWVLSGAASYLLYAGIIFVLLGILAAFQVIRATSHQRIFSTRLSCTPLLELAINRPNKAAYQEFLNILQEEIRRCQDNIPLTREKSAAGELRMLRRLSNQGFVTGNDYEQAKVLLLSS